MAINWKTMRDSQQRYLEYLDVMKEGQKGIADALGLWGTFDPSTAGKSPMLTPVEPLEPKELVATTFDYIEKLLAAQKQLAYALVESTD
ncbi:MAG: hypothetical protein QOI27_183 [Gaiellaceae bacterium]|jgi:hypothetical protein|nr:hypothetical protein [Gaiellaceae bacterium]MDX6469478.1 hypothetical protein [Gaiellaceae bacterium]MDX6471481.1 hypothetical protein [Gaiellaceae bacterium]